MPKTPYAILEWMWYLYVLIMAPSVMDSAIGDMGFAGLLIGGMVVGFLFLIPQILKGNG